MGRARETEDRKQHSGGPSSSGGDGQVAEVRQSSLAQALGTPAHIHPTATMPKRRSVPAKVETKPKRWQERIDLQIKKCKQKGKRGQRGNRSKRLPQRRKKIHLQKTERPQMRAAWPLMKQQRKKPSLNSTLRPVLSLVPVSLLLQPRGTLLSTVL